MTKHKKMNNTEMLLLSGGILAVAGVAAYLISRRNAGAGVGEGDTTPPAYNGTVYNPYADLYSILQPTNDFSVSNWFSRLGGPVANLLHPYGTPAPSNPLFDPGSTGIAPGDFGVHYPSTPGLPAPTPTISSGWTQAGGTTDSSSSGGSFGVHYGGN